MSPQPSPGIVVHPPSPAPVTFAGNVKSKLPSDAQTSVRFDDLPYMGEMTLDNAKPRRGRKPKKVVKYITYLYDLNLILKYYIKNIRLIVVPAEL